MIKEIENTLKPREKKEKGLAIIGGGEWSNKLLAACKKYNFPCYIYNVENTQTEQICQLIAILNNNPNTGGIVLGDLPKNIDREKIIDILSSKKDINGCKGEESNSISAQIHAISCLLYDKFKTLKNKDIVLSIDVPCYETFFIRDLYKNSIEMNLVKMLIEAGSNLTILTQSTNSRRRIVHCASSQIIISMGEHITADILLNGVQDYFIIEVKPNSVDNEIFKRLEKKNTVTWKEFENLSILLLLNHLMEVQ